MSKYYINKRNYRDNEGDNNVAHLLLDTRPTLSLRNAPSYAMRAMFCLVFFHRKNADRCLTAIANDDAILPQQKEF